MGGPALWSVGADYLTDGQQARLRRPARPRRCRQAALVVSPARSLLLGAPTDWSDPSGAHPGPGRDAVDRPVGAAGDAEGTGRRLRRAALFPKFSARRSKPAVPGRRLRFGVSARAKNIDAAKDYVKWLWVDQTDYQEDFALSYGFHIPARKSLAAKADKLQSRRRGRRGELNQNYGHAATRPGPRRSGRRVQRRAQQHHQERSRRRRRDGKGDQDRQRRAGPRAEVVCPGDDPPGHGPRHRCTAVAGGAEPQPVVLGVRRPLRARPADLRLPADPLERVSSASSTPATRSRRPTSSGSATTATCSPTTAFLSSLGTFIVFAVFIVPRRSRCRWGWRCWSTGCGSPRRSSGRSSSCRPRVRTSWRR